MRRGRWILLGAGIALVAVLLVVAVAGRWYLTSPHAAARVEAQLQNVYGGPVKVGKADVGLTGTSLEGVQLFEAGDQPAEAPWITAERVEADVSLLGLAQGATTPRQVTLEGVTLALHLDRDGKLLTRLPRTDGKAGTLPTLRVRRGQVHLRQDGRPEMHVQNVTGELRNDGTALVLSGAVADPAWGDWTLQGSVDPNTNAGTATLTTAGAHATPEKLQAIPYVPEAVWEQVRTEGDTPAEVTLRWETAPAAVHYRVVLEPTRTAVQVKAVDLAARDAQGKVVIEDGLVQLRGVRGQVAGGELGTNADFDFRQDVATLRFDLTGRDLNVEDLPSTWGVPAAFGGRLAGKARLVVTVPPGGKVRVAGRGDAVIHDAKVGGQPAKITLQLRADGDGVRFTQEPEARAPEAAPGPELLALAGTLLRAPDADPPPPDEGLLPLRAVGWLGRGVIAAVQSVTRAGQEVMARLPKDRPRDPTKPPSYLEANLELDDVDLAQLVKGLGVDLPFPVAGRVTLRVKTAIPLDTPRDLKTYRVEGTARLPRFSLAGFDLEQVQVRLTFNDGVLRLEELRGEMPDGNRPVVGPARVGTFDGSARLEVVPAGDLTARLNVDQVPLARVLSLVPSLAGRVKGRLSGDVTLKAPAAKLPDFGAWEAFGTAAADGLKVDDFHVNGLKFRWDANADRLKLTDLRAELYEGKLTGTATLPVRADQTGSVDLHLEDMDAGELARAVPAMPFRIEGRASGTVAGTLPAADKDGERPVALRVDLKAPRLRVQGIPTQRLQGTVDYRKGDVDYRLTGSALGGTFRLDGRYPSREPGPQPAGDKEPRPRGPAEPEPQGRLRVEGASLARLWEVLGVEATLRPLRGTVDLDVAFWHSQPDGVPVGRGRFVLSRLRWGATALASDDVRGDVRLTRQELRFRDLSASIGEGQVRGQVGINLRNFDLSWYTLNLDRVDAARLRVAVPALAGLVEGPANVSLRGTLGREWSGSGDVTLTRGRVLGAAVSDWRMPLTFAFAPARGRGEAQIYDSTAQVGRGRATVRATVGWGTGTRVEGQVRIVNADLRGLLPEAADASTFGAARVNARIDFGGNDVTSFDDLTATIDATFAQAQAQEFPVLRQLVGYVPGMSRSSTFQGGDLRGRLSGGVLRVQRLALSGPSLQLYLDGNVTVATGRLDLHAVANTGQYGPNPLGLRLLGLRLPTLGPVPLALIVEATNLLSNRVVHLRVTGTYRNPTIQVEPLPLLTDEAVRFFLTRVVLPAP